MKWKSDFAVSIDEFDPVEFVNRQAPTPPYIGVLKAPVICRGSDRRLDQHGLHGQLKRKPDFAGPPDIFDQVKSANEKVTLCPIRTGHHV